MNEVVHDVKSGAELKKLLKEHHPDEPGLYDEMIKYYSTPKMKWKNIIKFILVVIAGYLFIYSMAGAK